MADWYQRLGLMHSPNPTVEGQFGRAISMAAGGKTMVVGASEEGGLENQGRVYTFDLTGYVWVQRGSYLEAADPGVGDYYGSSVAISEDGKVLAVGATRWDGAAVEDQGAVYIYDRSGDDWVMRGSVLEPADADVEWQFGSDVALTSDGAILAAGCRGRHATYEDQGGVYIYDWSGGAWVQRGDVLVAGDPGAIDLFGMGVALSQDGEVLAVGATNADATGLVNCGCVYVYDRDGTGWAQRGDPLFLSSPASYDLFGEDLSLSADGEIMAVGANYRKPPGATVRAGSVFVFSRSGTGWVQDAELTRSGWVQNEQFGMGVSLSPTGCLLAAGVIGYTDTVLEEGAVVFFEYVERCLEPPFRMEGQVRGMNTFWNALPPTIAV